MDLRSCVRYATVLAVVLASVLAMVACGNREIGTEAGSGALVVVVNTPIARAGAVAIHGPASSTMRVAATDTLHGLTAREYLARAEDASASDTLVSPVLTGVMSDSAVLLADFETKTITGTFTIRGGSAALWVGKWGSANLAEGFTSPQFASGVSTPAVLISTQKEPWGIALDARGNLWVGASRRAARGTPARWTSSRERGATLVFETRGNTHAAH
jgi:hypothetical protein